MSSSPSTFSFTPASSGRQHVPNSPHPESERKHREDYNNENNKRESSKITVEELFNYGRVKREAPLWHKILFTLYMPFGILVLITRLFLFLLLCVSILSLPRSVGDYINVPLMKVVCGLAVRHNNKNRNKPLVNEPHIVACNHIADFDTFAMWAVLPKFHTLTAAHLKSIPFIGKVYARLNAIFVTPTPEGRAEVKAKVTEVIKTDSAPIVIFPEGGLTSGKRGTMMYHRFVFSLDTTIVPCAIAMKDPWPVHHDYLGSTWTRNFLWFLIVPFHLFELTLLPPQKRNIGESAEEFAERVQKMTCDYLSIEATLHSYSDKKALGKDLASGKKKTL